MVTREQKAARHLQRSAKRKPKRKGRTPRAPEVRVEDPLEAELAAAGEQTYAAWQDGLTPVERRINEIIGYMCGGQWVAGHSARTLAQKWGVSLTYVERLAADASRHVRRMVRDTPDFADECRSEVLTTFRTIRAVAMERASKGGSASHLMVALHATRLFGFYTGIEPAKKLETTPRQPSRFEGWTREQVQHFVRTGERPTAAPQLALVAKNGIAVPYANGHGNGSNGHAVLTVNGHGVDDDDPGSE